LAHGEEGLGFTRAMLFAPIDDAAEQFVFRNAVGPLRGDERQSNLTVIRSKSLAEVLTEAALHHDEALNRALNGFGIPTRELSDEVIVRYRSNDAGLPPWVKSLWERTADGNGEALLELLVARVTANEKTIGLLVADRKWDDLGLIDADEAALESFGRHAGHILLRHVTLARRFEDIDRVIATLYHETREMLPILENALAGSRSSLQVRDLTALANHISAGTQSFRSLEGFVTELEECFRPDLSLAKVTCGELFAGIEQQIQSVKDSALASGVQVRLAKEWPPNPFMAHIASLGLVVRNLLRNAHEALAASRLEGIGEVVIWAEIEDRDPGRSRVNIHVQDNGRGAVDGILSQIRDPLSTVTSKRNKKGGVGLLLSRVILRGHGGGLSLTNVSPHGFRATICLPLKYWSKNG
jgi:signal transduction histidine kinase